METRSHRFLSATPTLRPKDLIGLASHSWKDYFPFTDRNGLWTFSGRVALYLGLQRLRLRPGSTILVPSYFQGTEIDTLLYAGYKLRFYRIDSRFAVDLADVEKRYDGEVSALYIIHYFGLPQDLDAIESFCKQKGIALCEDCALSLFSRYKNEWLGSRGDLALFSIHKTLPLPHGGYLVTKVNGTNQKLLRPPVRSSLFQTADLVAHPLKYSGDSRMKDLLRKANRAIRKALMKDAVVSGRLDWDPAILEYGASTIAQYLMGLAEPEIVIRRRRENFEHLRSLLEDKSIPLISSLPPGACPLFYPLLIDDKVDFQRRLASQGIDSINLWSQNHPACPEDMAREVAAWRHHILELPIHHQLDGEDIQRIGTTVAQLLAQDSRHG